MHVLELTGAAAALAMGLTGGLHCAAMCGPLACAAGPARSAAAWWHLGRLAGYAVAGALAGAFGQGLVAFVPALSKALPWVMAAGLVLSAAGAALPGAGRLFGALARPAAKFSPRARAGAWGALTPLWPCGLLYGVVLTAAATGSALGGVAVMAAFTAGSAPALFLTQWTTGRLRLGSRGQWVRRVVLLAAAAVLAYRGWHAPSSAGEKPSCHETM